MSKQIIVSEDEYENRIALLEDKELTEIFSERKNGNYILSNIYKGKVNSVLPGMQVAFVDIGLPRNAFLHISDVNREFNEFGEWNHEEESKTKRKGTQYSINDLLKKGQEILVQIDKESIGSKGPRVTAYVTLPGRYLVLMPTVENIGVSRKIENEAERRRLKDLVLKLRQDKSGYIVRTAAEGKGKSKFAAEMKFLTQQWEQISQRAKTLSAPALVQGDLGLTLRVLRDMFTEEVSEFVIDSKVEYRKVMDYLDAIMPNLKPRVKLYGNKEPIFETYGIEKAIRRALRRKIWLKSGGYIVIEQTEAMVSIDVNTGKYVGKKDPDDTILKTNLEAVKEVTRQIRLRDIGGIIVIDFIDMDNENHRKKVFRALREALKEDRSRTNILSFTELGLVEMTRQRTKPSLTRTLCQPCPYCNGYGSILSEETITIDVLRAIKKAHHKTEDMNLKVIVNDIIAMRLLQEDADNVQKLKDSLKINLEIDGDADLHMEEYRIISLEDNQEIYLD